jgi:CHAT domain-containing protein
VAGNALRTQWTCRIAAILCLAAASALPRAVAASAAPAFPVGGGDRPVLDNGPVRLVQFHRRSGNSPGPIDQAAPLEPEPSLEDALKTIDRAGAGADAGAAAKDQTPLAPLSFTPPPHTIDDITAILDKQKPDPARHAAALAEADRQVPSGASPADLVQFYFGRGLAAREIGRDQQFLDDLKKTAALDEPAHTGAGEWHRHMSALTSAYQDAGDYQAVLELQDQRLRTIEAKDYPAGFRVSALFIKTVFALMLGRRDVAADALQQLVLQATRSGGGHASLLNKAAWWSMAQRAQARFAEATGHYAEAEGHARRALYLVETRLVSHEAEMNLPPGWWSNSRNFILGELTSILMRENRLVEAEAEIRIALLDNLQRQGRYAAETARTILTLARVLDEEARYAESERLAAAARDTFLALGHGKGSANLATTLIRLAAAQSSQLKMAEARATYAELERVVGDDPDLRREDLDGNLNYIVVALLQSRTKDAVRALQDLVAHDADTLGNRDYATAQARGWLGVALVRAGDKDKAAEAFAAAMPVLLSSARESETRSDDSVARREQQTRIIGEAYLALLADTAGAAAIGDMFTLADALRGRMVEHALAASSARATASDPALADLARHEQDAQKQIVALQNMLATQLAQPTGAQEPGMAKKLQQEIDRLHAARSRIRREIERKFVSYTDLVEPKPATLDEVQKSLRPGEAMIATFLGNDRIFVWAVPDRGTPAFAATKVSYREIAAAVAMLRRAVDPNASTLDEIPEFDLAAAYRLYEWVLKPVETGWASAQTLMIVPHRALGALPLGLLVTLPATLPPKGKLPFANYKGVPFLVRKLAVAQLPSAGSLAALRALPPPGGRESFIGFGDPWFSAEQAGEARAAGARTAQLQSRGVRLIRRAAPQGEGIDLSQLPRLPDTADEVRSIALVLHADVAKDVILGAAANEKTVRTMNLADRRIIVFATHGLVPGDLVGLTQPALALSAPKIAGIDGDGLLTVDKILGLKLNADWVVLSACNTAAGAGAEAISGLGRAFFYAGARALLVSNWPVETGSARWLTSDLFRRAAENPGLPRAEALRQAELALIDGPGALDAAGGRAVFSYAHPIFWAPFSVVGDGGAAIASNR